MAVDFFRIDRGLVIDELAQITTRPGTPSTADEAAAPIGSLFLETDVAANSLNLWYKFQSVTSTVTDWAQLASKTYVDSHSGGSSLVLYSENPVAAAPAVSTGANAVSIGHASVAAAAKSLAIGEQSLTRIPGSVVIASGRFGSQGDAQAGKYLVRAITPGNIPAELFVEGNGGSTRLVLPDNSTWTFRATITAHQTNGSGHAGFEISGVIYRDSGAATTAMQGAVGVSVFGRSDAAWRAAAVADTVNGALKIMVTGSTGKIVRWLANVETVEVTN